MSKLRPRRYNLAGRPEEKERKIERKRVKAGRRSPGTPREPDLNGAQTRINA